MIKLLLISILLTFTKSVAPSYVQEFHDLKDRKTEQQFIDKYQNSTDESVQAYIIALRMKKAKYTWNPLKKISIFKRQKKALNKLIVKNPNNIHLRYIRLLLQEKTPKILGYNKNIADDKEKILYWVQKKDSTDYLDEYIIKNTSL
ncbi:MAG: hypothetical protein BM557_04895 [Flavobacterium sp. MedPE-SWcel]|uniref:hypothetical protein n=1 Tax=uncultured Flavobacterium sp. TaxID=165435 RepID=UPI00090F0EC3|nr:hypothetical protein [uncultured Flavobacterium sp.]OIQ21096.1 MAG: hypothetical protein BM557_04895 [Flavobacterium sp. MedPE-SWcel]